MLCSAVASLITAYTWKQRGQNIKIKRLFVFPIKSCGGIEVSSWPCHSTSSAGMSSRNRDAGLYDGEPHADRTSVRDR